MRRLLRSLAGTLMGVLLIHLIIRLVRHFIKFPIPRWAVPLIDNPLRWKIQPPDELTRRHRIGWGMRVLEVGPGTGRFTIEAAKRVGGEGSVTAIDIQPQIVADLRQKLNHVDLDNISVQCADVYELPYPDDYYDAAFMVAVIGEIPDPVLALRSLGRVLKPGGTLACSELLPDPDYPLPQTLRRWANEAGLDVIDQLGGWLEYTMILRKR